MAVKKGIFVVILLPFLTNCLRKSQNIQFKLMPDGNVWTTENLNIMVPCAYSTSGDTLYNSTYGLLYTWQAANNCCEQLGNAWRLPTNEEWQSLAKTYGGVYDDSDSNGKPAYLHLLKGGNSEFNALLSGNREVDGIFNRFEEHGFYCASSEYDSKQAWFYNFAKSAKLLNRHTGLILPNL